MAQGFSLKDQLFNAEKIRYLAGLFRDADPSFDHDGFQQKVMERLLELELKQRIDLIADVLSGFLPSEFPKAADLISAALPQPLNPKKSDDDFGDFIFAPLGEYVVNQGLERHRERSMQLFEQLTQRFSMEFALRPFLNRWPEETLSDLTGWLDHPHYHVRRLVSESTRPKLPWGKKIGLKPSDPIPFLDRLHSDPTRFVTRSVANHLNDISKTDSLLTVETLEKWHSEARQDAKELQWMTRHALRTLVKLGDPAALGLLGYRYTAEVTVTKLKVSPETLAIGEAMDFSFVLNADADEPLLIDYVIDFAKAGGRTSAKVFKLKTLTLKAGHSLKLKKTHRFKGDATTFTLYPGKHQLGIQVNGRVLAQVPFELTNA